MAYIDDIIKIWKEDLPWEKLTETNILITGATGLIGGCLVDAFMLNPNKKYVVYASGRNEERARIRFKKYWNDSNFRFIRYEVTLPLISNVNFTYIIHAASGAAPNDFANHPVEVMKANINGVANLMEYGIEHQMRRFLYISSGEVYGEGDGRFFTEDYSGYVDCTDPRSCYPSSKRAAETLCVSFAAEYGADVVIARPCHVYGPKFTENDNRVYAQFIRNVLRNEDIIMKSTGEQFRSWCYVVDCVSALLFILLCGESKKAYNIADGHSNITIRELAETIAAICNRKVQIDLPAEEERRGYNPVTKSVFDTSLIDRLGWKVTGSLYDKMKKTIEFCREKDDEL